ncbi:MAG: HlyD family efflux transporter periplasmic adaptor subunit [Bacteroidales bacterium]|nr:HlyD family efflux transporter periplasmic adaptor subunit [Bacteroidales bacterium]MDD3911707.1 HlyD family efflux transporter periplasmic adaptor subunit [Bacteroidales bacterium]MDD4420819.1 HlyD family efflux transporter periplasmic adaptor subunit [Bacteroidales bacterium]
MKRIVKYSLLIAAAGTVIMSCAGKGNWDATGTFEATEITVSSETAGKILYLNTEEGNTLTAGEVAGVIDTTQLYLQKLQLQKSSAALKSGRPDIQKQVSALREQIAKQEIEKRRVQNLLKDGAATTKQLDDVNSSLKVLNGQLSAQLSSLNNSTASINDNSSAMDLQISQINDKLEKSHIKAPVTGTILAKYSEAGEFANIGRPLFKIADLDNIYLRAYFTSEQLSKIKLGQKVNVTADFGGNKTFDYQGQITWIASESEFTPKTIQTKDSRADMVYAVKIAVKNDGRIKIGMYGEVKL